MKLLSLNIWNINEPLLKRTDELISGIKEFEPDIICLQEVSPHPTFLGPQSEHIARKCGFSHHIYSQSGLWNGRPEGLAIISKHPIVRHFRYALPQFPADMERQLLVAQVDIGFRLLLVGNTHLAFPLHMTDERASQVRTLLTAAITLSSQLDSCSIVICGDFNDVPHSPALRLISDADLFYDSFATRHPGLPGHTFSSHNRYVDRALGADRRIDYVFATSDLQLTDCMLVFDDREAGPVLSDHFGLLCTFGL